MGLLPDHSQSPTPQTTTKGKFLLYLAVITFILLITWWSQQPRVQATLADWKQHSFLENIVRLISSNDKLLKGEKEGRINIILLGMGGAEHDGPYLTDTIMLVSLNPQTNEVAILSIPRDLAVDIPDYGVEKINSANAVGEAKQPGNGASLAADVLEKTFNLPIHYYIRIDFNGFIGLIDQLGGLKINVPKAFSDSQYPDDKGNIKTISFAEGEQLLSGERILEYVRSRHGSNGEASDFSRARRQQQVLIAAKEKILKLSNFLNPQLLVKLYQTFSQNIETNIDTWEIIKLSKIYKNLNTSTISHIVLDSNTNRLLKETRGDNGAYLLVPRSGSYLSLQKLALNLPYFSLMKKEQPKITIANGTNQPGLAEETASWLKDLGLIVTSIGNAPNRDYGQTVIYDLTNGNKLSSAKALLSLFDLDQINKPDSTIINTNNQDFHIILGNDKVL